MLRMAEENMARTSILDVTESLTESMLEPLEISPYC